MAVNVVVSKAPVARPIIESRKPGETLSDVLEAYSGLAASHCRIQVNGEVVSDWQRATADGDNVIITQIPTGLDPITWIAIASLALSVASYFLFKPDEPEVPENEKARRVKGDRNQNKAYEPIPFVLGRRKLTPAYMANPYYEYVGRDQYYRMLLDCGYGPLNITDLRIGEVPITSFTDVQYAILDWYNTTDIEPLRDIWARDVTQNVVNEELPREDDFRNSFIPVGRGLTRVTVAYPNGLYWIKGSGSKDELNGSVQVEYQGSDDEWYTPVYYNQTVPEGIVPYALFKEGGVLKRGGGIGAANWGKGAINLTQADTVPASYIVYDDNNGYAVIKAPASYYVCNIRSWAKTTKFFTRSIQFDQSLAGSPDTENSVPLRARNLSPGDSSSKPWTDTVTLVDVSRDAVLSDTRFEELIGSPSGAKRRAVIALRIKATDQVSGTLDSVNCTAESVVPAAWSNDWRDWFGQTLTPTRNPADLYRWVLQGPFNNAKVGNARINLTALNTWKADCVTEGWEASDLVNYETTLKQCLNNVAKTGRAEFTLRDGRFSVAQMKEQDGPVQIFTPKNSSGFQSKRDFPPPSDGIKVEFQNEDEDFELDEWTFFDPEIDPGERVGQTDSLELWGVTKPELAQRHARFAYLEKRLRRETYELTTDIENLACARGDEVWIQNDIIDVGLGSGRIKSVGTGEFSIDETIGLVAGNDYGVIVRNVDSGTQFRQISATYDGGGQWSTADSIEFEVGDLASYGVAGEEVLECIVTNVKPQQDVGAVITLVNAANEIYTTDGEALPVYDTNLTPRPENQPPAVPTVKVGLGSTKYGEPTAIVTVTSDERIADKATRYRLQYRIVTEIQEDIDTGEIVPEEDRAQMVEDAVWIDAPDVDARVGSTEVPIPLNTGNVLYFRAKAAGSGNLMSAWSDEVELVVSEQPAPDVDGFTVTEQINTPKTPDGMFSTLVITVDEPAPDPYLYAIAEYRLPGQDEWQFISRIGWQFASEAEVQVLANGTQYQIRVRSVSVWGVENFYGVTQLFTTTNVLDPEYTDENPYDVLPVPNVSGLELFEQGNDAEFTGKDAKFAWRRSSVGDYVEMGYEGLRGAGASRLDQYFRDYQVEIWADNKIVRTEFPVDPVYIYSHEKNAEDYKRENGVEGAWRDFECRVYERGRNNQISQRPAKLSVSNTAPAALSALSVVPGFSVIEISYLRPTDLDFAGVDIWISETQGFDPDATEPTATVSDNSYVASVESGTTYYVRLRPFDFFGRTGTNTSAEFEVITKTGQDLDGLSGWAYEIDPVDEAFIEDNLAADAVPSTKIKNLTAAKITTGTLLATETITSEGVIRAVDDINAPTVQTGIGPAEIGGTTYLMWSYNGTDVTFGVDELGNVTVTGAITIASGSSGISNLSDAGSLATKNQADSGDVAFNYAGSSTKGGNASDTDNVNGQASATVKDNANAGATFTSGDAGGLAYENSADWSTQVSGAGKPEDNATFGADWESTLSSIPDRVSDTATVGLNITDTFLGYYDGTAFKSYIQSDGSFHFGSDSDNFIDYNGTNLVIETDNFSVDASGNAVFSGELQAATGVFGDEGTGEYIKYEGGVFEVGPNATIGSNVDRTVTVGPGGDFTSPNEALVFLSKTIPAYKSGGFTATIQVLDSAGFVWDEETLIDGVDLSWIRIESDTGAISVDISTPTTTLTGNRVYSAVIAVRNGGRSPVFAADLIASSITTPRRCVIGASGEGSVFNVDGIAVEGGFNCVGLSESGKVALLGSLSLQDSYDANAYLESQSSIAGGGVLQLGDRGGSGETIVSLYMSTSEIRVDNISETVAGEMKGIVVTEGSYMFADSINAIASSGGASIAMAVTKGSEIVAASDLVLSSISAGLSVIGSKVTAGGFIRVGSAGVAGAFLDAREANIVASAGLSANGGDKSGTPDGRLNLDASELTVGGLIQAEADVLGTASDDIMMESGSILRGSVFAGTVNVSPNTFTADGIHWQP